VQHWPILIIFGTQHYKKKLDVNKCTLAHLTLIPLLHYIVKCRGRSLAAPTTTNSYWGAHVLAQKITDAAKSLKTCYIFNISRAYFKIVRRRTEITHQQRVNRSGSPVIKRAAGESRQRPRLAFVLEGTF